MRFVILDERDVWHGPAIEAARRRGYDPLRVKGSNFMLSKGDGVGFIRPHAEPKILELNQEDYYHMQASGLTMIQDPLQMSVYEDKSAQHQWFHEWMPLTRRFVRKNDALDFINKNKLELVSKADVGASSVNVRILPTRDKQIAHVQQVFDKGVAIDHCSGGHRSIQKGYVLLQEFIPHQITWRVNIVGRKMAVFKRYCYPDKPVAMTGNTDAVIELDAEIESLLDFARKFFSFADTRWCAVDILKDTSGKWKVIETSLAWPWPGVGKQATFFGSSRTWDQIWDVMFDEFEEGVWS
jgi:hypothetical protein